MNFSGTFFILYSIDFSFGYGIFFKKSAEILQFQLFLFVFNSYIEFRKASQIDFVLEKCHMDVLLKTSIPP